MVLDNFRCCVVLASSILCHMPISMSTVLSCYFRFFCLAVSLFLPLCTTSTHAPACVCRNYKQQQSTATTNSNNQQQLQTATTNSNTTQPHTSTKQSDMMIIPPLHDLNTWLHICVHVLARVCDQQLVRKKPGACQGNHRQTHRQIVRSSSLLAPFSLPCRQPASCHATAYGARLPLASAPARMTGSLCRAPCAAPEREAFR